MTDIEILAFIVSPLLLMGLGLGMFVVTGWLDRPHDRDRGAPAE